MSQAMGWGLAILVMMGVTFAIRALPLAAARWLRSSPFVDALNRLLPLCVMVVLLVFSLRGTAATPAVLVPELLALAVVAGTYVRWRNPLASVVIGLASLNGMHALLGT